MWQKTNFVAFLALTNIPHTIASIPTTDNSMSAPKVTGLYSLGPRAAPPPPAGGWSPMQHNTTPPQPSPVLGYSDLAHHVAAQRPHLVPTQRHSVSHSQSPKPKKDEGRLSRRLSKGFPWGKRASAATLSERSTRFVIGEPVLQSSTSDLVQDEFRTSVSSLELQGLDRVGSNKMKYQSLQTPSTGLGIDATAGDHRDLRDIQEHAQRQTWMPDAGTGLEPISGESGMGKSVSAESMTTSSTRPTSSESERVELQRKLRESEEKRRDLLIEYQAKLDNERKRVLQLQGKIEQLARERSEVETAVGKTRQLEQQRDALREALMSLRETKDMEINELRSRLMYQDGRNPGPMTLPISPVSPAADEDPREARMRKWHTPDHRELRPSGSALSLAGAWNPSPPVSRSPSGSVDVKTAGPRDSDAEPKDSHWRPSHRVGIQPLLPITDGVTF